MDRGLRRKHLFFNPLEQATAVVFPCKCWVCRRLSLVILRCLLIAPTMLCLAWVELFCSLVVSWRVAGLGSSMRLVLQFMFATAKAWKGAILDTRLLLRSMNSALSRSSGLNWAQKTLATLFASTLFIYGLDRTVPGVHNFLMGAFSCHGGWVSSLNNQFVFKDPHFWSGSFFVRAKKSKWAIKIALTFKEQQMILLENSLLLTP